MLCRIRSLSRRTKGWKVLIVLSKNFRHLRMQHSTIPTYDSFCTNVQYTKNDDHGRIKMRLEPQTHLLCIIEETHKNTYLPSPSQSSLHNFSHHHNPLLSPKTAAVMKISKSRHSFWTLYPDESFALLSGRTQKYHIQQRLQPTNKNTTPPE